MTAGVYNLEIKQGSTYQRAFTVTGLDLTTYTGVRMKVREFPDSSTVVWSSADHAGSLDKDATSINLTISSVDTALFTETMGYDIELYTSSNPPVVDTILIGRIVITEEYTK